MKHKLYKKEKDIIAWLNDMHIGNYKLIDHPDYGYTVDVQTNVRIENRNLTFIPVKFNGIEGDFICSNNNLKTLYGSPDYVNGHFDCGINFLTNLLDAPQFVGSSFVAHQNKLISLQGITKSIKSNLYIYSNKINTLKYCPLFVGGKIEFFDNPYPGSVKIQTFEDLWAGHRIESDKILLEQNIALTIKAPLKNMKNITESKSNKMYNKI